MFYFSDNSLILCYSSCFVWYSNYGDSSSSKKLKWTPGLESMSFLGALISVLKDNTFHNPNSH